MIETQDLVRQLTTVKVRDAEKEIESLRQQLAYLQEELGNPPTDWHLLKQQLALQQKELHDEMNRYDAVNNALAECQLERDAIWESYKDCRSAHDIVTKQRDELVGALEEIDKAAKYNQSTWGKWIKDMCEKHLAKLGADKTGEGS